MHVAITEEGLELLLEREHYAEATLHKCFYWYTRDYRVSIAPVSATQTRVCLQRKEGEPFTSMPDTLLDQVHNDLIDFKLRELIADETRTVRELLLAKAFAHYDTEQPLGGVISDPVGFHPLGEPHDA